MEERENTADHGVPDMTMMPEITEQAINDNLKKRYIHDLVYVSFYINKLAVDHGFFCVYYVKCPG